MSVPRSRGRGERASRGTMMSRLDLLIGDKRRLIVELSVISIITGFAEAGTLAIVGQVAAALVRGGRAVHVKIGPFYIHSSVKTLIAVGFGLTVLRFVMQWPLSTLPAKIASQVQSGLRERIFGSFARASWDVQSRDREGQLQEIMTNQTSQATAGAAQTTSLIIASFTFAILMVSAIALSPLAAAVVFGIAVIMFSVLRPLRALGARRSRELSAAQVEYASGIAEANRLAQEVQVFGVTEALYGRTLRLMLRCRDLFYRVQIVGRLVPNLYQSLIYLVLMVGLFGLSETSKNRAGSLGAVVLLLLRASQNGQSIQASYQSLQQSLPFIERLQTAAERYESSIPPDGELQLPDVEALAFERVSFAYTPGRPVLADISFSVEAGEVIGIVGPSGAGKSTLVQLLLQLRVPDAGRYLVDGVPVERFKREDWHRFASYVPQEPRLLRTSVAENIRFMRDIDDQAVERAARLARIHDDIVSWSDGYDTIVGPRADAVSGGQ
ncbi:MAG TPA: ABC transporter ATP-binding protein, partial [Solirubrobacteraceae bacterium]|nr:ABC transporter ATP-binding protein [Solirubrobacteraceae bacterium]